MKKIGNGVVALSSAAIIAVYAAGHARTRSAAEELDAATAQRRPVIPAPAADVASGFSRTTVTETIVPAPTPIAPVEPKAATATSVPPVPSAAKPARPPAAKMGPAASETTEKAAITTAEQPASAVPAAEAPAAAPPPAAVKWKDGTYRAWGRSRHGDMLSFVVIENGRIVHAGVDKCQTRWPCSLVAHLYPQVLARQSAEVDYVTGATQSANAFYYGLVDALAMAAGAVVEPRPIPQ
jgi:uncharacterized protein with FMN-binding domain